MNALFNLRGKRNAPKQTVIKLFHDQNRTITFRIFAILLMADILANTAPPHFAFLKKGRAIGGIQALFQCVPVVKIFLNLVMAQE